MSWLSTESSGIPTYGRPELQASVLSYERPEPLSIHFYPQYEPFFAELYFFNVITKGYLDLLERISRQTEISLKLRSRLKSDPMLQTMYLNAFLVTATIQNLLAMRGIPNRLSMDIHEYPESEVREENIDIIISVSLEDSELMELWKGISNHISKNFDKESIDVVNVIFTRT